MTIAKTVRVQTRIKMLKVKIKSLAAEAQIIRLEERRSKPGSEQQGELHGHRVHDVRKEQRHSMLAYAFLRGVPLSAVERTTRTMPDWTRVGKLVEKFGVVSHAERSAQTFRFAKWRTKAEPQEQSLAASG